MRVLLNGAKQLRCLPGLQSLKEGYRRRKSPSDGISNGIGRARTAHESVGFDTKNECDNNTDNHLGGYRDDQVHEIRSMSGLALASLGVAQAVLAADPIKLGVILPISGGGASVGLPDRRRDQAGGSGNRRRRRDQRQHARDCPA